MRSVSPDKVDDFQRDLHYHQNSAVNQSILLTSSTFMKNITWCFRTLGLAAWLLPKKHITIGHQSDGQPSVDSSFVIPGDQTPSKLSLHLCKCRRWSDKPWEVGWDSLAQHSSCTAATQTQDDGKRVGTAAKELLCKNKVVSRDIFFMFTCQLRLKLRQLFAKKKVIFLKISRRCIFNLQDYSLNGVKGQSCCSRQILSPF